MRPAKFKLQKTLQAVETLRREKGGEYLGWGAGGAAATYMLLKRKKKEQQLKWECVEVSHHKSVGGTIEEWERNGWNLYSYTAAGNPGAISHYLLFMRSELKTT